MGLSATRTTLADLTITFRLLRSLSQTEVWTLVKDLMRA
jgi:hypothetical protein